MMELVKIEQKGVQLLPLDAKFPEMPFEEWVKVLVQLCRPLLYSPWWIGACLASAEDCWLSDDKGKRNWGNKYRLAIKLTRLDYGTLRNFLCVYRSVSLSRRRDKLSWSHHAAVAALDAEDQETFLALAVENEWTRSELRQALRAANKDVSNEPEPSIGFVAEPCINELLRGFNGEVTRRGPPGRWPMRVKQAWRIALKPVIDAYEALA